MRSAGILAIGMALGCAADEATSTTTAELQCFHTPSHVACVQMSGGAAVDRTKIEDFYPSACFDGDADGDGTPDFLDLDFLGSDAAAAPIARDDLRCPRCNRGPGTQNDFRLRTSGAVAELERGKVYVENGNQLVVPTPEGPLAIAITASTEVDDGDPAPGAEIRVEGAVVNGVLEATRLKVLCPAPLAVPPKDVPTDAEPVLL